MKGRPFAAETGPTDGEIVAATGTAAARNPPSCTRRDFTFGRGDMDGGVDRDNNSERPVQTELVLGAIIGIITEMLEDWGTESDGVEAATLLAGDLGFASVDLIHLVVAIEEHFGQGRMKSEGLLIKDSRHVDDLAGGGVE